MEPVLREACCLQGSRRTGHQTFGLQVLLSLADRPMIALPLIVLWRCRAPGAGAAGACAVG